MTPARTSGPIAFLFPAFPNLHQTFVLWEVLALRQRGVAIALFSIKRPVTRTQQPEAAALRDEVHYLPPTFAPAVLAANLATLVRAPGRYLAAVAGVVRGWWEDRAAGRDYKLKRISEDAPDRERTWTEEVRGRFNRSALMYLLKSLWLIPRAVYLGRRLQAQGIGRLHAHWASYSATMALVVHWIFDVPFSFTAHAYDIYLVPRLLGAKVREAEFTVTCARVNAEFLAGVAGAAAARRVIVNYHGVSRERFQPIASQPHDMPCVVTCGRLEPYKGHHVLLRACAALGRPVRCIVVGEGPQRRRLEQLAAELGIADRVEFTGPVPQSRLAEIYARADVFVLASVIIEVSGKRDVIPNVLAEAMAMQLPVVASNISGIGELVSDGVSGRLVAPNDAAALAAVIDGLLADPEQRRRLALNGAAAVAERFDRDVNIEALAALFGAGASEEQRRPGTPPGAIGATAPREAAVKLGKPVQDALSILGTRVVWSAMGIVSGVILARWLGPYDRGILALALLIPSTVVTVVKLGVSQATVYYINRKDASVDQVASNSVYLALGLGVVSSLTVWLLRDDLQVLRDIPTWALAFALVRVPLLLLDNYLFGVLQATGQFGVYNSRLLLSEALRLALVAIFVMVLNLGLLAAVIIYTAIGLINMGWLMATMSRTVRLTAGFDRSLLTNMLSFGVRSYVQVVTAHLLLRISIYMVQSYLGPAQTAFYALALHLTETVLEVPQAIGLVLYPRLASLPEDEVHRLTAQTCRRTLMVTVPAAIAMALFGPWLIVLWYGEAYAPAGAPLPWAAVGVAMMSIFVIITRDFTARSKQRVNTMAGFIALAGNVLLNLYLIPRYGITGAAFATAVSYTGACALLIAFFLWESRRSLADVLVPTRADVAYFATVAQRAFLRGRQLAGLA